MFDYYNYTYCIRCDNLERIEQALTSIFEIEGCDRICLPPLSVTLEELHRNPSHLCNEVWTIGLFRGSPGWTIIKALPEEILCRRATGVSHPRLLELAMHTSSDAFYLGVYNSYKILIEVHPMGGIFVSGAVDSVLSSPQGKFVEQDIHSPDVEQFFLLEMPNEEIRTTETNIEQEEQRKYEQWEEQFLTDYAKDHFPLWTPNELEQWKAQKKGVLNNLESELPTDPEWEQLYGEWTTAILDLSIQATSSPIFEQALERLLGGPRSYWYLTARDLIYRAYTQQEQLEADGARLVHFRPAERYRWLFL